MYSLENTETYSEENQNFRVLPLRGNIFFLFTYIIGYFPLLSNIFSETSVFRKLCGIPFFMFFLHGNF